nr:A-kinase anchor protein 1, mitochondrial isoform X2 [Pongo pygmaeus]
MAIQFRSLFPLALPGMLALLSWWWFFSRKKGHVSSHDEQVEAGAVQLRADPAIKEPLPMEDVCPEVVSTPPSVTEPPETELSTVSKLPAEPPALLRTHPPCRRSESSGILPNTTDMRSRPGTRRDNSTKLELALTGGEAKSIPLECPLSSPKGVLFPNKSAEVCKQDSPFSRVPGRVQPGYPAVPAEKRSSGERARETGGAEGTGDAVLGRKVVEEALLSQEHVLELENSKGPSLASLEGEEDKGKSSSSQVVGPVQEEEYVAEKLPSRFIESAHTELAKDDAAPAPPVTDTKAQDRGVEGELGNEESLDRNEEGLDRNEEGLDRNEEGLDRNEEIEQAAFQIISQVISEATEQVLATTVGKVAGRVYQASQLQGQKEESCVPVHQKTVLGSDTAEPAPVEAAAAPPDAALPLPGLPAEGSPPPKTYVSCLNSPLSSPTKDSKPKISAHHISLAPCLAPTTPSEESPDRAGILVEDATCATCMSDSSQSVPLVASPGHCSDSFSTSGLEDSCTETSSSPRDKAITPPLPESTVPFSNGVLKGELSDLGAEDGWTMDAEADHSGALSRSANWQAGALCEFSEANIWCQDLHFNPALHPERPDLPHRRVSTSCRQSAELDWEEVQRAEPHQYLRSPIAFAGAAFSADDILVTVICAAPGADGAWWRAQVVASYEETNEVEIRYVDYGGYKRVKVDVLRQIRSDFVTLPFQGAEVLLDSVMPLSDDDQFSPEADAAMSEMTGNTALLAQVTSYSPTGLPLIQLWSVVGDEVVLINRSLVERGLAQWVDSYYASL